MTEITIRINTINNDVLKKDIEEAQFILDQAKDMLYTQENE